MSSITTRAGKGSELSHTELDDNFTNLNTDKIENITGESLSDLTDVNATAPTDGQALAYDNATSKWTAQTISGGGGDVVNDTTPQLGGDLDVQNNVITTTGTRITIGDSTNKPIRFQGDSGNQQLFEITPNWTTTDSGRPNALMHTQSLVHNEAVTKRTFSLSADDVASGIDARVEITVPYGGGFRHVLKVSDAGVKIEDAYTLPTTDGTANQVIETDGAGTLTWATPSAGGASAGDLTVDMMLTNTSMSAGDVVALQGSTSNIVVKVGDIQTITGVAYNGQAAGNPANNYLCNRTQLTSSFGNALVLVDGSGNFSLHEYTADGKSRTATSKWYTNNAWEKQHAIQVSPTVPSLVYCIGSTVGWGGGIQNKVTARAVDIAWNNNSWTHTAGSEFQISSVQPCSDNALVDIEPTSLKFATCYRDDTNCNNTRYMTLGTFVDGVANLGAQIVGTEFDLTTSSLNLNQWGDFHYPIYTTNGDLWLIHRDDINGNTQATQITYNSSYNVTGLGSIGNITNNHFFGQILSVSRDPHNADHFVAVHTGGNNTMISYFSILGTTVTPISDLTVVSGVELNAYPSFEFDPINASLGILTGRNQNQTGRQEVYGIDINRGTNTFTVAGGYHLNRYNDSSPATITHFTNATHTNLIMISERSWTQGIDEIGLFQVGGQSSNVNNVVPLGILQTGGAHGTLQTVRLKGGLSTIHAGLTTGMMYGVDNTGALVDATSQGSVHTIGKAISSTSILQRTDI
jgi:hypothetical protein